MKLEKMVLGFHAFVVNKKKPLLTVLIISSFLFFCLIPKAQSALPLEVQKDLSALSALVIGWDQKTVVLDKGRSQGVKLGDIFTIYRRGEPVIHPQTKKVLGHLKTPVAKVEIIKVEGNFATGKILAQKGNFPVPTPAIRFGDLKIMVLVSAQTPHALLSELKETLSQSKLILDPKRTLGSLSPSELQAEHIDLVIFLSPKELRLYNPRLELIRAYTFPRLPSPQVSQPQPLSPPIPIPTTATPGIYKEGQIPLVIVDFEMGDLDEDGIPEMVYLTPQALYISRYRGKLLTRYPLQGPGKVINFSLGPRGWLALNIYRDQEGFSSLLMRWGNGRLKAVISGLNFFLSFVDFNGDGWNDTLLGQTFSAPNLFGEKVYILGREGNQILYRKELRVPPGFRLLGSTFADFDGDGEREILTINPQGLLEIYRGKNKLWEFKVPLGGSIYVPSLVLTGTRQIKTMKLPATPAPLVLDLQGDGRKEVLWIANPRGSQTSSRIWMLTYGDRGPELKTFQAGFRGYLQGLGLWGAKIFALLVEGDPSTQRGISYLLSMGWPNPKTPALPGSF